MGANGVGVHDPISNKPEFGITMIVFIAVDIDGDGIKDREAIITGQLSIELEKVLILLGVDVMPISDGTYSERHARVNKYAAMYPNRKTVYLAMHFNAGGGNYAAFFYHHASTQGHELANQLALGMRAAGYVKNAKAIKSNSSDWTKNAFYCIKGIGRPVAICSEPLFMDQPEHAKHLTYEGIQGLAMCMANAIVKWGSND